MTAAVASADATASSTLLSVRDRRPLVAVVLAATGAGGVAAAFWWWQRRRRRLAQARICEDPELLARLEGVREAYQLSTSGGFLTERCLSRLPPSCVAWEAVASELPSLNRLGRLRARVDAMQEVDAGEALRGAGPEAQQRAYIVLGMLAHSYVHGPAVPWHLLDGAEAADDAAAQASSPSPATAAAAVTASSREVPQQLARPWFEVCRLLRMPPVLTAALDLWNWQLRDAGGRCVPSNLELRCSMTGTATETNFHMVPCAMQAAASAVVPKVFLAPSLLLGGGGACRDGALAALLRELADVLREFRAIFAEVPRGVDRDVFYDIYRPLLDGFYPEGVTLLGVSPDEAAEAQRRGELGAAEVVGGSADDGGGAAAAVVRSKGPSAGQSTMVLLFDLFLGVGHDAQGTAFQEEMLGYMPERHRQMVRDFREVCSRTTPLRSHVLARRGEGTPRGRELAEAYDECVAALRDLRRFHLATVSRYLTRTETGTGASTWKKLLQATLDSTAATCLGSKS